MRKVLLFCTEGMVPQHYSAVALIGRALQEQGHDVVATHCAGAIPRCVSLDSMSLPGGVESAHRPEVCHTCTLIASGIRRFYGLKAFDIGAHLPSAEVCDSFMTMFKDRMIDATVDGVAIGRLALHDVILAYKIADFSEATEEMRMLHHSLVRSAFVIYAAVKTVTAAYGFQRILVYGQYVQNMAALAAARAAGAEGRLLGHVSHRNVDRRWVFIEPLEWRETMYGYLKTWPRWREAAWKPEFIKMACDDLLTRFGAAGSHVYSPAKTLGEDVRRTLNIPDGVKIAAVFTSSLDEQVAQDQISRALGRSQHDDGVDIFENQIEWLSYLVEKLGGDPSRHLVVRVHPREGSNKREQRASSHLALLRRTFAALPNNVTFLWPEDVISSYDLMEAADACLVSWSTIGLEAARLGVPVLSPFGRRHVYPQDCFVRFSRSPEQHLADLNLALERSDKADVKSILTAFHWYLTPRFAGAVDLSDIVPTSDFAGLAPYRRPQNIADLERQIFDGPRLETYRAPPGPSPAEGRRLEAEALRRELRRIIHFLLTGVVLDDDVFLETGPLEDGVENTISPGCAYLEIRNGWCRYAYDGQLFQRRSPAAARLAAAAAHIVRPACDDLPDARVS